MTGLYRGLLGVTLIVRALDVASALVRNERAAASPHQEGYLSIPQGLYDQDERERRRFLRSSGWTYFRYQDVNPSLSPLGFATPGGNAAPLAGSALARFPLGNYQSVAEQGYVAGQITQNNHIYLTQVAPLLSAQCQATDSSLRCFKTLDSFNKLFEQILRENISARVKIPEEFFRRASAPYFDSDEAFARERITISPLLLKRVDNVTDAKIREQDINGLQDIIASTGCGTLQCLVAHKKLFIGDLTYMNGVVDAPPAQYGGGAIELPIGLFFTDGDINCKAGKRRRQRRQCRSNKLMPLAILYTRAPGSSAERTVSPKDSNLDWFLAKAIFNTFDSNLLAVVHFVINHFALNNLCIASHVNLADEHPIYQLLENACRNNNGIIYTGITRLLVPGGVFDSLLAISGSSILNKLLPKVRAGYDWNAVYLDADLRARGVKDIPHFSYRDDAGALWAAIRCFVRKFLQDFYTDDSYLLKDKELQAFLSDLYQHPIGRVPGFPAPSSVNNLDSVVDIVAQALWLSGVSHHNLNSAQIWNHGLVFPHHMGKLWELPPPKNTVATEEQLIYRWILNDELNITAGTQAATQSSDNNGAGVLGQQAFCEAYSTAQADINIADASSAFMYWLANQDVAWTFLPFLQVPDRLTNGYLKNAAGEDTEEAVEDFRKTLFRISKRIRQREDHRSDNVPRYDLLDPNNLPYFTYI